MRPAPTVMYWPCTPPTANGLQRAMDSHLHPKIFAPLGPDAPTCEFLSRGEISGMVAFGGAHSTSLLGPRGDCQWECRCIAKPRLPGQGVYVSRGTAACQQETLSHPNHQPANSDCAGGALAQSPPTQQTHRAAHATPGCARPQYVAHDSYVSQRCSIANNDDYIGVSHL